MTPATQALLGSWTVDPMVALGLLVAAFVYSRGWLVLHRLTPNLFPRWRLVSFLAGLIFLWISVSSPLDAFSSLLLSAHMVQHLLLLMTAPALMLLGSPALPLLRGLPRAWARDGIGPFLRWQPLRHLGFRLTNPVVCWLMMAATLCLWHVPAAFELALRSPAWHKAEHVCFVCAALLFWWPVVRPFPYRPRWPLWSLPVYLLAADLVNTALSAILTFSDRVLYPTYVGAPRLFGTTALTDQATAGVIMWVPGSLAYLIPAVVLSIQFLSPAGSLVRPGTMDAKAPVSPRPRALPPVPRPNPGFAFDLLTVPLLGRLLRSRSGRKAMQVAMLLIALGVIADGVLGPQISPVNLAGVLPWTYWRALVVVTLLAVGNCFCMACPFTLPRELGRRAGLRLRPWPRALRSKRFAIALLVLFFIGYEAFGLWDKPIWTAWLIINYFLVAFAIDGLFQGASFCKYVCPIGQFQFIASLVSPFEVKIRSADACAACKTHDCLRGNERQRGCQMDLFLPRKAGNLDCTFCLDCVRACPHDNVGLIATAPGMAVVGDPQRSSLGRQSRRLDLAAMALVFVFAAFVNAAFMTATVASWRNDLVARLGLASHQGMTSGLLFIALVLAPAAIALSTARASRALSSVTVPARELLRRFSLCLVPLGAAMWAAHFLFHLNAGWASGWTAFQRATQDAGLHLFNFSTREGPLPLVSADAMLANQTVILDAGLLLVLYLGWRVAQVYAPRARDALRLLAPWAGLAMALYGFGIWVFLQPMEMRGVASPMY